MISGNELRLLRKSAGLSQSRLAEKLGKGGYTKTIVSAIEKGRRNIGLNLLTDWALACGHSVDIAFKRIDPTGEPITTPDRPPLFDLEAGDE